MCSKLRKAEFLVVSAPDHTSIGKCGLGHIDASCSHQNTSRRSFKRKLNYSGAHRHQLQSPITFLAPWDPVCVAIFAFLSLFITNHFIQRLTNTNKNFITGQ